jgi:hypothetical protein
MDTYDAFRLSLALLERVLVLELGSHVAGCDEVCSWVWVLLCLRRGEVVVVLMGL